MNKELKEKLEASYSNPDENYAREVSLCEDEIREYEQKVAALKEKMAHLEKNKVSLLDTQTPWYLLPGLSFFFMGYNHNNGYCSDKEYDEEIKDYKTFATQIIYALSPKEKNYPRGLGQLNVFEIEFPDGTDLHWTTDKHEEQLKSLDYVKEFFELQSMISEYEKNLREEDKWRKDLAEMKSKILNTDVFKESYITELKNQYTMMKNKEAFYDSNLHCLGKQPRYQELVEKLSELDLTSKRIAYKEYPHDLERNLLSRRLFQYQDGDYVTIYRDERLSEINEEYMVMLKNKGNESFSKVLGEVSSQEEAEALFLAFRVNSRFTTVSMTLEQFEANYASNMNPSNDLK